LSIADQKQAVRFEEGVTAMAARQKKEVAVKEAAQVPAQYDYGEDAGAGFENQTSDDYAIPFLGVLQPMSPQLDELDAAKAGMLFNTVTNTLWNGKDGLAFVPCHTEHVFVEWVPRDQGGGFVDVHQLDSPVVAQAKKESDEFGQYKVGANDLQETFYVYGMAVTDSGASRMVVAFTSTKIKKYKGWMTMAREIQVARPDGRWITPPMFAHQYRITTVKEKNQKGDFWNFSVAFDGDNAASCRLTPDSDAYQMARGIRAMVVSGAAKADYTGQEGGQTDDTPNDGPIDDNIPF